MTNSNSTVTLAGNIKLVKSGAGAFRALKANQTYTGGTFVPVSNQTPCRFEVRNDGLYAIIRNTIIIIR